MIAILVTYSRAHSNAVRLLLKWKEEFGSKADMSPLKKGS